MTCDRIRTGPSDGSRGRTATTSPAHAAYRVVGPLAALWRLAVSAAVLGAIGCANPGAEFEAFVEGVQRVPLGADDDVARFFMGFPTKVSRNQRNWWYLRPEPTGPVAVNGGLSALVRFNEHDKVVERELIEWVSVGKGRYRLRSERLIAGAERPEEADFAEVLGEKLAELASTSNRCCFSRQDTSYQLVADGVLLLSMDRWARPGSRLISVRGEIDANGDPQAAEAVRLAWQIRRFAIELDFDRFGR